MTFNNTDLYCQVLGSIMKEPSVLSSLPMPIAIDDFSQENQIARVIYFSLSNLIDSGTVKINAVTIEAYLQDYPTFQQTYRRYNGREFVMMCLDKGQPENFTAFYNRLKKNSLLRDLKLHGYDISPYDVEEAPPGSKQEFDCITRYEEATEEDILAYVEKSFSSIRSRHTYGTSGYIRANEGLRELLEELAQAPEIGPELNGAYYNSVVRGAIRGKMYLRSGGTNVGKTRWSVFDACSIVFPIHFDEAKQSFVWVRDKEPQKVLFITTEMKAKEIQTIILAYVAGVEEQVIKLNACTAAEKKRIAIALDIIDKYSNYFILESIEDPNLNNVQTVIKKHVLLNDVGYVFYDYIFSSPSLISQFSSSGIREDVALGMLSNQLKEIAANYNVFVMTSTQVNGDGLKVGEKRDQRNLRGSKAIADKCDVGCLIAKVDPTELEQIHELIKEYGSPTHVTDIYKLRNGTYKGCRIWSKINLGTGFKVDLFMTDEQYNLIPMKEYEFIPPLPGEEVWVTKDFLKTIPIDCPNPNFEEKADDEF